MLDGEVEFTLDDESVLALPGTTLNVPPNVWHQARSPPGAPLLTIFSPGGFDRYPEELVALPESRCAEADFMREPSERDDIFER